MRRSTLKPMLVVECLVTDIGVDGMGVAKVDEKVVFVEGGMPGDRVQVQIYLNKVRYAHGRVVELLEPSVHRVNPVCQHFGICGGCKWQNMDYATQLVYKTKQVHDALTRIGGISLEGVQVDPALPAPEIYRFRNKLEFTFTNHRWLTKEELLRNKENPSTDFPIPGVGFHLSGRFERILHIETCYLMDEAADLIRNSFYNKALELELDFYDIRSRQGYLRNLMLRNTVDGQWMVLLSVSEDRPEDLARYMEALMLLLPQVQQWLYTINSKANDSLEGLDIQVYHGQNRITETLDGLHFGISATSFFQTNPGQALALYRTALDWCALQGDELVYDLYTGTGSIALFLARHASKVIGIEYVEAAVEDARRNAAANGICNAEFYAGDMTHLLNEDFYEAHGRPKVVVVDPPRAGMHTDVVEMLSKSNAERIVYVSCNAATQARDLRALNEKYRLVRFRPVDLFPQTAHIENIALLLRR
ncbi:MAG: 23S rRNA (uracil(1939)-C(5))-methyltransferase RlmD [Sphingomonadales bacterium]|nr:23S rRNA (uracil(1939)-C(5))-methyltransferase RlmD [Sphingomonadales bacterium]